MKYFLFFITAITISCTNGDRENPFDAEGENWYPPKASAVPDTVVSQTECCTVNVAAEDANPDGSIKEYYWDVNIYNDSGINWGAENDGWEDTTDTSCFYFCNPDGGRIEVVWGVQDNDGLIDCDTFSIMFNRIPDSVYMNYPGDTAVWNSYDFEAGKGSVLFKYGARDPDGDEDTLFYTLWLSRDSLDWTKLYSGKNDWFTADSLDTLDKYFWRLCVSDIYGDSAVNSGSFSIFFPFPNSIDKMVLVPASDSAFSMGTSEGAEYEGPAHIVNFTYSWYIDTVEVTNTEFVSILNYALERGYLTVTSSSVVNTEGESRELLDLDGTGCEINYYGSSFLAETAKGDNPVIRVSWYGCAFYANMLSELNHRNKCYDLTDWSCDYSINSYRLSSEAEWEYSCRAGTDTRYYWGDIFDGTYVWCSSNCSSSQKVGIKLPNGFGLYDMSGNVWEWCNDWYENYSEGMVTDPRGSQDGEHKVLRGGSWRDNYIYSASRGANDPGSSTSYSGFRVVLPVY